MEEAFLALVKLGIGNAATEKLPDHIDWDEVETLAEKQSDNAVRSRKGEQIYVIEDWPLNEVIPK